MMEYCIVRASSLQILEDLVTTLLEKGWQLYGTPLQSVIVDGSPMFYKEMIRSSDQVSRVIRLEEALKKIAADVYHSNVRKIAEEALGS